MKESYRQYHARIESERRAGFILIEQGGKRFLVPPDAKVVPNGINGFCGIWIDKERNKIAVWQPKHYNDGAVLVFGSEFMNFVPNTQENWDELERDGLNDREFDWFKSVKWTELGCRETA